MHVIIKSNLMPENISAKYMEKFPIKSITDLEATEMEISPETMEPMVTSIFMLKLLFINNIFYFYSRHLLLKKLLETVD